MIGAWLLAGGLVGVLNGFSRWWTVARLRAGGDGRPLLLTLGGLGVRLTLVAALLIAGLKQGIAAGLLAFAGLWLAQWATVIWVQASELSWPATPATGGGSHPPELESS